MKGKDRRPFKGAREAAWRILVEWEKGEDSLEALREKFLARLDLSRKDRALVTELTQGIVRHRLFLNHNINSRLTRPDTPLPEPVRQALFLGAYQILLLDRIPSHSAVNESVNLLKNSSFAGFSSLVNAVLRKIASSGDAPIPDFEEDPARHMELAFSFPRWLINCLTLQEGFRETFGILQALNERPPLTLRVNTIKTSRTELLEDLSSDGISASAGLMAETAVIVHDGISPLELPSFLDGRCVVQDEGAQLIAPILDPRQGSRILDACAAPGGKTGHLAQITQNAAFIAAVDLKPSRVQMMVEGLSKLGTKKISCVAADLSAPGIPFPKEVFQLILLDAPCSGTGVLKRHPEGKWNKDRAGIQKLAAGQRALLRSTSRTLCPGGRLLYSTCSILREEDEDVIHRFLKEDPSMKKLDLRTVFPGFCADFLSSEGDLRLWPHRHHCDGFFACLLEKRG